MNIFNPALIKLLLPTACFFCVLFSSCDKEDPDREPLRSGLPVIDSITPKTGPVGTEVTVHGSNLGSSTTVITVNGKAALNKTPNDRKFVITIADSTFTGPIVVKNNNGQTTGPVFTYIPTDGFKVITFAGGSTAGEFREGTGTAARFNSPSGIAIDGAGNVYVADTRNYRVRKITPGGVVSTLAGSGSPSPTTFGNLIGIAIDQAGNVYAADETYHRIRRITPSGVVSNFAGTGNPGSANGPAQTASFTSPAWIAIDRQGDYYISETGTHGIRFLKASTLIVSDFAGGNGPGSADGPGSSASFRNPRAMVFDQSNAAMYLSDFGINKVRRIVIASKVVFSPIGSGVPAFNDDIGVFAAFSGPSGLASDPSGNLYVSDLNNQRIRKVSIPGFAVTTLAGNGTMGFNNGNDDKATFRNPYAIVRDTQGNFYVVDQGNHCIRKMTPYQH